MTIQTIILKNLISNDSFTRKVIPFIRPEYFEDSHKRIFAEICKFVEKYNKLPNFEALSVEFDNANFSDSQYKEAVEVLSEISQLSGHYDDQWLLDNTEKFCKDRALHLAVMKSFEVITGTDKKTAPGQLPELLSQALSLSFDTSIGHDWAEDMNKRYDWYHNDVGRIPFDLEILNTITNGGLPPKTLNILMASTGVGKSTAMCHMAGAFLADGKNVLYITLEMSEEQISARIDANLFNVPMDGVVKLSKSQFTSKVDRIKGKTNGRLIIKEYPTSAANVSHFRSLIKELAAKKKFVPDVILIDYLNICSSARINAAGASNSYIYVKAIAEEIRGLAIECAVPIISATQSNRDGANNSDMDLTNTSESWGLPGTADLMIAMISTPELEASGQILLKQLKNRYNDMNIHNRFIVGLDRPKMRLYDVDTELHGSASVKSKSDFTHDSKPVSDNNSFRRSGKHDSSKFKDIQV